VLKKFRAHDFAPAQNISITLGDARRSEEAAG